jgi:hypothetical protein
MIYDNYNSFSTYVILRDNYDNKSHKLGYGPPITMDTYAMYTTIHNTVCIYNTICKKYSLSVGRFWNSDSESSFKGSLKKIKIMFSQIRCIMMYVIVFDSIRKVTRAGTCPLLAFLNITFNYLLEIPSRGV